MLENIVKTAVTPLQNMDEITSWENRPFSGRWTKSGCDNSTDIKRTIKKKPKRIRTAYTTEQVRALERIFNTDKYITAERRKEISLALNIGDKSVKIWFQNRRMKEKRSSSESSDSSSDTTGDISPPLPTQIMNQEPLEPLETNSHTYDGFPQSQAAQFFCNYSYMSVEPAEYELPDLSANGMQFYNDNYNVYPIHYYPANECINPNDYYYDYQNQPGDYYNNINQNNYWTSNSGSFCQFYS